MNAHLGETRNAVVAVDATLTETELQHLAEELAERHQVALPKRVDGPAIRLLHRRDRHEVDT